MDEKDLVMLFLKNGFQVSADALPMLKENPEFILEGLKKLKPRPFIVCKKHVRLVLDAEKKNSGAKRRVQVLKEFCFQKKAMRVDDYVNSMLSFYEAMRKIIMDRVTLERLISINKISEKTQRFSIIGLVREKGKNSLLVEDPTGEVHVFFGGEGNVNSTLLFFDKVCLDDVVGLKCRIMGRKVYATNIFFPDVALDREIRRTKNEEKVIVVCNPSSLDGESQRALTSFIRNSGQLSSVFILWGDEKKRLGWSQGIEVIDVLADANPILYQLENLLILTIPKSFFTKHVKESGKKALISMLRRRCIISCSESKLPLNGFVLQEPPDVILSYGDEDFYTNYKGTTIISNTDPHKLYLLNTRTREVVVLTV
ncbi:MAG: hypothetical protein ACTSVF_05775 [Candidatus Asgardarchaeia archaeon]